MTPSPPDCDHCGLPVPKSRTSGDGETAHYCCFGCRMAAEIERGLSGAGGTGRDSTQLLRLGLGIFLALNVMVFSWLPYAEEWFGPVATTGAGYDALASLFSYLLMFLSTAALALLAAPIILDLLSRTDSPRFLFDAKVLILVAVFSAYTLSVLHTLTGVGPLYYDTATFVLVLVTLGGYVEARAKRGSVPPGAILTDLPPRVTIRRGGRVHERPVTELELGDHVLTRAGETVAVDGPIVEGRGFVDESCWTGESRPQARSVGAELLAGAVVLDGPLWVEARAVGSSRAAAAVERAIHATRARPPFLERITDRVAAIFVPLVIALALGAFFYGGLTRGLSVLLISCPCALGLVAPLATRQAIRRAIGRGIRVESAAALERAAAIERVFFDKTGTLTSPALELAGIETAPEVVERQAIDWAAALESELAHPLARAIREVARARDLTPPPAEEREILPGYGVAGRVGARQLVAGSLALAGSRDLGRLAEEDGAAEDDTLVVFLFDERRALARFHFKETLRADAGETIRELEELGIGVSVLTGDRPGPARRLERLLAVPVQAQLDPAQKADALATAQRESHRRGRGVAMVGDGINDALVVASADLGVAVDSALDLTHAAGQASIVDGDLRSLPELIRISRQTARRIRVGLAWAFGYNGLGVGLALAGYLGPLFAASAMFLSSLILIGISRGSGATS